MSQNSETNAPAADEAVESQPATETSPEVAQSEASAETSKSASPLFSDLGLDARILEALTKMGFKEPTAIQGAAMPPLLEGKDVIGRARTGSGKTAAFGLPLLEKVKHGGRQVRALVLAPTRELAVQVSEALQKFAEGLRLPIATVYGGASYGPQLSALRKGVPIVVGTPGRVLDHLERGTLDLSHLEMLVLDEADEMLRMGFLEDVERVLEASPDDRQVALFSATMPKQIKRIADDVLNSPQEIQVESTAVNVNHIEQRAVVVPERFKIDALRRILAAEPIEAALIFARTRAGCAETADTLAKQGLQVDALHGDLNQAARERVLMRFRAGGLRLVVATDVAARGIDVERLSHVVNLDLPNAAESYVHRIGRTGRAGRSGVAISLATPREAGKLRFFERSLKTTIKKIDIPSDATIAHAERQRLLRRVIEVAEGETPVAIEEMLSQFEGQIPAKKLAAAMLKLLADQAGVSLAESPSAEPPRWVKNKRDRNRRDRDDRPRREHDGPRGGRDFDGPPRPPRERSAEDAAADAVELFLPVGRRRGVRPADLVGAMTNGLGIRGGNIGRVTILEDKTFVRTSEEAAKVLLDIGELEIRGRSLPVSKARPRQEGEEGERPFRPKNFGGGGKFGKGRKFGKGGGKYGKGGGGGKFGKGPKKRFNRTK